MKIRELIEKLQYFDSEEEIIDYNDEYTDKRTKKLQIDVLGFNTHSRFKELPSYVKLWFHYE